MLRRTATTILLLIAAALSLSALRLRRRRRGGGRRAREGREHRGLRPGPGRAQGRRRQADRPRDGPGRARAGRPQPGRARHGRRRHRRAQHLGAGGAARRGGGERRRVPPGADPVARRPGGPGRPADARRPRAPRRGGARYYRLDGAGPGLHAGERLRVQLAQSGGGERKTVPYSAVIYWIDGGTWVYTRTGPLAFVRSPIEIDEVDGDVAVLQQRAAGRHPGRERRRPGAARHRVPDRRRVRSGGLADDAVDRQVEPAVPLHRGGARRGHDGLRRRRACATCRSTSSPSSRRRSSRCRPRASACPPQEVEQLITIPMEQALNSTPGLDVMRSKSVPGLSAITLFFKRGTDSLEARQLVNERVAIAIPSLPASAGIPWVLQPLSATSRALKIGLSSNTMQPDRPVDDRLLDDPLAADGGAGRRQRRDLGRPLEAAAAAVRSREAARAPRHDRRRRVGGLATRSTSAC